MKNIGLFNVASFAMLYFMINVFSENEKLIYLKLSNIIKFKFLISLNPNSIWVTSDIIYKFKYSKIP